MSTMTAIQQGHLAPQVHAVFLLALELIRHASASTLGFLLPDLLPMFPGLRTLPYLGRLYPETCPHAQGGLAC